MGPSAPRPATFVISPPRQLVFPNPREMWRHRHVLSVLIWRNVVRRYRQTLLGPLWFIIRPLVRMTLFSIVLGKIAGLPSEGVPYPIFTFVALLPWELFTTGVSRSTACFITYHHIISKVYFPRLLVPTAEVFTALVDFGLGFAILLMMMVFYGFPFTARLLVLPFLLALSMALALAVGLMVAALQARFRDVSEIVTYLIQFWFYATPVAYSAVVITERIPDSFQVVYRLNPMYGVVEGFRWALLGTGHAPDAIFFASTVLTIVLLFASSMVFLRSEQSIVDLV